MITAKDYFVDRSAISTQKPDKNGHDWSNWHLAIAPLKGRAFKQNLLLSKKLNNLNLWPNHAIEVVCMAAHWACNATRLVKYCKPLIYHIRMLCYSEYWNILKRERKIQFPTITVTHWPGNANKQVSRIVYGTNARGRSLPNASNETSKVITLYYKDLVHLFNWML